MKIIALTLLATALSAQIGPTGGGGGGGGGSSCGTGSGNEVCATPSDGSSGASALRPLVTADLPGGGAPTGVAGGKLTGTYPNPGVALASGDIPNNAANTLGNANTATALAALPTPCSTGSAPTGILANGNSTSCAPLLSGNSPYGSSLGILGNQTGGSYLMSVYSGANTSSTTGLMLGLSSDGLNFGPLNCSFGNTSYFPTSVILWSDGKLYTISEVALAGATFVVHSTPDCHTWTLVSTITPTQSAVNQWAPQWEMDPVSGQLWYSFAAGSDAGNTMSEYIGACSTGPTGCSNTTVAILGTNHIDSSITCLDGSGNNCSTTTASPTYYLFFKDETSKKIGYGTSTAINGTYTVISSDIGIGTNVEAPSLVCMDNSAPGATCVKWALYNETYQAATGVHVSTTTSFPTGWGSNTLVTWQGTGQGKLHHASVIKVSDLAAVRLLLSASVNSSHLLGSDPGSANFAAGSDSQINSSNTADGSNRFGGGGVAAQSGEKLLLACPNSGTCALGISSVNSSSGANINFNQNTTQAGATGIDGSGNYFIYQGLAKPAQFYTNAIIHANLSSAGGLFVGTGATDAGAGNIQAANTISGALLGTSANCSSAASPAVCAAAASGSVVVAAAATAVTVNTTAVTANSQIQLTFDSSLGTKLTATCNTTPVQPTVSARVAATSFTITLVSAPITNPACFSYSILN